jgi:hypothetical protein
MRPLGCAVAIVAALALAGCATAPPAGPSVLVLPAKDKTLEAFQLDDAACRQYAAAQIGYSSPSAAETASTVNGAALGTVLGAAAGAAIGAAAGNPAAGAAIGAGGGLLTGGAIGFDAGQPSRISLQRRYDMGYVQCMAAKGETVPTAAAGYPAYAYYPDYAAYYPYYPAEYGRVFFGFHAGFGFHDHHFHHFGHGHH